jgi:peroxiredoxin family protein
MNKVTQNSKEDNMSKMVLALVSGGMEKLTAGGIMLSGGIAQDMEVKVFLLLGGAYAFRKGTAENMKEVGDFQHVKEQFLAGLQKANVPYWLDFYKKAKQMGKVTIYLCSTAGKIWGSDKLEDYVLVDTVCGIGEYITAAQEADLSITL